MNKLILSRDIFLVLVTATVILIFYKDQPIKFLSFFIYHFERVKSKYPGEGAIKYLLGVFLASVFFTPKIAAISIIILAIGDSVSTIIGHKFGKIKVVGEKTLEGSFAGFLGSFIVISTIIPILPAFIVSFLAMVVEAFDCYFKIDDNILIPLVSGLVLTLLI